MYGVCMGECVWYEGVWERCVYSMYVCVYRYKGVYGCVCMFVMCMWGYV